MLLLVRIGLKTRHWFENAATGPEQAAVEV
jgi:hypothetical protein